MSSEQDRKGRRRQGRGGTKCPVCGKPQAPAYRPFCSKACVDVDLSRWLSGRYAIPGEPAGREPPEEDH